MLVLLYVILDEYRTLLESLLIAFVFQVKELRIDYTNCFRDSPTDKPTLMDPSLVHPAFKTNNTINAMWQHNTTDFAYGAVTVQNLTKCTLTFDIPEEMSPPVFLYYRLENFYQNHRRYVASFYDKQLLGNDVSLSDVYSSSCQPLATSNETYSNSKAYYPCGLIANSLFNDTLMSPILLNVPTTTTGDNTTSQIYEMKNTSIAWESDKALYGNRTSTNYDNILPPPNWQIRYPGGVYSDSAPPPNIHEDEHFIVWMRTAGLPTFSKLYGRNDTSPMLIGTYSMDIIDSKPSNPPSYQIRTC